MQRRFIREVSICRGLSVINVDDYFLTVQKTLVQLVVSAKGV
jgi:hypothetical protein